jgi:hypothetical protein
MAGAGEKKDKRKKHDYDASKNLLARGFHY